MRPFNLFKTLRQDTSGRSSLALQRACSLSHPGQTGKHAGDKSAAACPTALLRWLTRYPWTHRESLSELALHESSPLPFKTTLDPTAPSS